MFCGNLSFADDMYFAKRYIYCDSLINSKLYSYVNDESNQAKRLFKDSIISYSKLDDIMKCSKYSDITIFLKNDSNWRSNNFTFKNGCFVLNNTNSYALSNIKNVYLNLKKPWYKYPDAIVKGFIAGVIFPLAYEAVRYPFYKDFKWGPTICCGSVGSVFGLVVLLSEHDKIYFQYPPENTAF